jgi:hypothetical protein
VNIIVSHPNVLIRRAIVRHIRPLRCGVFQIIQCETDHQAQQHAYNLGDAVALVVLSEYVTTAINIKRHCPLSAVILFGEEYCNGDFLYDGLVEHFDSKTQIPLFMRRLREVLEPPSATSKSSSRKR